MAGTSASTFVPVGWKCPECDFELYLPVDAPSLEVTRLGLYNDARFRGRCLLALGEHAEHLDQLDPSTLEAFWRDAARVGGVLRIMLSVDRINYAVLGNVEPHLHVHLIPRRAHEEQLPSRPPWNDPRPLAELDRPDVAVLGGQLTQALSRSSA